jgi:hypothetical protein
VGRTLGNFAGDVNEKAGKSIADACGCTRVDCVVETKKRVQCVQRAGDVYVPFNAFLRDHFDVTGQMAVTEDNEQVFAWSQSYAQVRHPTAAYTADGVFGPFATYNVENREKRVACIAVDTGLWRTR